KSAANALLAASFAPVVTVAVYGVLAAKSAKGVNVAVLPLTSTVATTVAPPELGAKVKVAVVRVEFVIASARGAATDEFSVTCVIPRCVHADATSMRLILRFISLDV